MNALGASMSYDANCNSGLDFVSNLHSFWINSVYLAGVFVTESQRLQVKDEKFWSNLKNGLM